LRPFRFRPENSLESLPRNGMPAAVIH